MTHLQFLFNRYTNGQASPEEQAEFFALLQQPGQQAALEALVQDLLQTAGTEHSLPEPSFHSIVQAIVSEPPRYTAWILPARRWAAAAAILLLCGGAAWWWARPRPAARPIVAAHIAPGQTGALLTLANGQQVQLDSVSNGVIASQQGSQAVLQHGALLYSGNGSDNEHRFNTLQTPRGRQFHIVLPDGTEAWLNAASSIRYPLAFGASRTVSVTGEVYFEVAKDPQHPFKVMLPQQASVAVLGTRFNVNVYDDEAQQHTTLLDGAVKVNGTLLQPGQEAVADNGHLTVTPAHADRAIAWKNGVFDFEGLHLRAAMRQIARWYDINIVYEGTVPDVEFYGKLKRDISLENLLLALKDQDIHFRLEGRNLILYP